MTRNPYDDNTTLWAGELNALANAPALELVKSGCTPSKGSGDWDIDIASGTIIAGQSSGEVSVSSQTVTLTNPDNDSDMDSGESRIDLVSINSSGTGNITEGSAAADPASPDIPGGEVLVARIQVADGDSTAADSDLFDSRVLFGPSAYPFDNNDIGTDAVDADEVAPQDNLYVYDEASGTLRIYDISNDSWSTASSPPSTSGHGAAGGADGNIYVTDLSGNQLMIYDVSADSWSTSSSINSSDSSSPAGATVVF